MTMLVATALIVLASSLVQAQPPAAPNLRIDVVVVDGKGAPVMDLRPAEFEVWISGLRVPIEDVFATTPGSPGRTVVLVLDDGTLGPTLAPRVKETARHFVAHLAPGDRMAIVSLNDERPLELTADRARLTAAIEAYHTRGFPFRPEDAGQHVLRRMESIARQLIEVSDDRKTIVGIGAGWVFDTPLPPPGVQDLHREWVAAMRAMATAHASLYVIDPAGITTNRSIGGTAGSSGFARETGGHAFLSTNDLKGAATRIWNEAGAYYMLAMENPPVQRTADLREVEVKVLRRGITVHARRGIKGRP
jgi:VWFA-related protein